MEEATSDLSRRLSGLNPLSWAGIIHWIDILLVAFLLFRIFKLIRGRQAWRFVWGIVGFLLALYFSEKFGLTTVHYLLDKVTILAPVALAILFLPELRQAIETFGRIGLWSDRLLPFEQSNPSSRFDEILTAVGTLAEKRMGALIVMERHARIEEIVSTGVRLDAAVSASLLESIFYGENPLHDGAVVIRGDKVIAAACRLPLSESTSVARHMHLRHRAGIGATERADCAVVVVSEERGTVSIGVDGKMTEIHNLSDLRERLMEAFGIATKKSPSKKVAK